MHSTFCHKMVGLILNTTMKRSTFLYDVFRENKDFKKKQESKKGKCRKQYRRLHGPHPALRKKIITGR